MSNVVPGASALRRNRSRASDCYCRSGVMVAINDARARMRASPGRNTDLEVLVTDVRAVVATRKGAPVEVVTIR